MGDIVLFFLRSFRLGQCPLNEYVVSFFENGRVYKGAVGIAFVIYESAGGLDIGFVKHNRERSEDTGANHET